jgi:hypothetical protein
MLVKYLPFPSRSRSGLEKGVDALTVELMRSSSIAYEKLRDMSVLDRLGAPEIGRGVAAKPSM